MNKDKYRGKLQIFISGIFVCKAFHMALRERVARWLLRGASKQIKQVGRPYIQNAQPSFISDDYEEYIEKGYTYNATLYSIINLIATNFSRVPWAVYDKDGEPVDHPLNKVLQRPNVRQGQAEFMEQVVGFKLLTGNTYIHTLRFSSGDMRGQVGEMYTLPSQHIDIYPANDGSIAKYVLSLGDHREFPGDEVIHLKYWTPEWDVDGRQFYGLSPVKAAARILQIDNDSVTSLAKAYQNQGIIGFFSLDEDDLGGGNMEEQIQSIEERYRQKYMGPHNRNTPMFTSYKWKWQKLGVDPVDLAILAAMQANLRTLCNIYHVPSPLLNDPEKSTYNNLSEARKALWTEVIIPELESVKDELNRSLIPKDQQGTFFLDYDTSEIESLQKDLKELITLLAQADWLTDNEKREMMEKAPIEDESANILWKPLNLIPAGSNPEPGNFNE